MAENFAGWNLDHLDNLHFDEEGQTIWRWSDEGFEFFSPEGDLDEAETDKWRLAANQHGDNFEVCLEETGAEEHPHLTFYRVSGGALAPKLHALARRREKTHANSFASMLGVSKPWEGEDMWRYRSSLEEAIEARKAPVWEGSHGFRQVWESVDWMVEQYFKPDIITGLSAVAADTRVGMFNSHPVVIPPEQARVIPTMPLSEAVEYLLNTRLPFDPLFIDTTSGPSPRDMTYLKRDDTGFGKSAEAALAGGLLLGNSDGSKQVMPCGSVILPDEETAQRVLAQAQIDTGNGKYREDYGMVLSDYTSNGLPSHGPIAGVILSEELRENPYTGISLRIHEDSPPEPLERIDTMQSRPGQTEICYVAGDVLPDGPDEMVVMLAIPDLLGYKNAEPEVRFERLKGWAAMASVQFRHLVSCLQFLESHNVEIVEAKVSRQVRRQAERKGISISSTVYIRHRRSTSQPNGDGAKRDFSHSFEVIGHTNHVTRGKHVWCRACRGEGSFRGPLLPDGSQPETPCERCGGLGLDREMLTPCARRDQHLNLTCPNGCRKEWVPPFVKGEGPLILKTRKQT